MFRISSVKFKNYSLAADQRDSVFVGFSLLLFFRKLWKISSLRKFLALVSEVVTTECFYKYPQKIS